MDQSKVPLLEFARNYLQIDHAPFYMPGHKRGHGIDRELKSLLGENLFRLDLPELPQLDEAIAAAETLAAAAYGAEHTWFLVNGSTCGVAAMILATCTTGDKILIGRNCHKSAISALVLAGAKPIYLETAFNSELQLDCGVRPATLEFAIAQHPDAKAVMVVSPNYYGICGEIEQLVAIAHAHNLPMLVDAAHGAHLGFHPNLPISAIQAGADVVVQSTHKMASSLTQSAMLHMQGNLVSQERINQALQLVQSTSPNLLLLTSLDVARRQLVMDGKELLEQTLELAAMARAAIAKIPNLFACDTSHIPTLDPTRLTVNVAALGMTGFAADQICHEQLHVMAEMPTLHHLVFALSIGNTAADITNLVKAFTQLHQFTPKNTPHPTPQAPSPKTPHTLTPREAFFAKSTRIPFSASIGYISTELVCPYPPGIPVICPGEEITKEVVEFLQIVARSGGVIHGCGDPALETIAVVRSLAL